MTMTSSGKRPCSLAAATTFLLAASLSLAAAGSAVAGDDQAPADNFAGGKTSQQASDKAAPPVPAAPGSWFPAQPPAADKPGFLHELGRWWDAALGKFGDFKNKSDDAAKGAAAATQDAMKNAAEAAKGAAAATQDAMKNAAEAAKGATSAIVRLPNMRVIEVSERCPTAPNGAPDCRAAATNACRAQGFNAGQPMGVRSSENCPPAVLMSGRTPAEGECPVETVVLLAACQ